MSRNTWWQCDEDTKYGKRFVLWKCKVCSRYGCTVDTGMTPSTCCCQGGGK